MDDKIKHRKPIHLKYFDYKGSAFVYFITICTADKQSYFSNDKVAKIVADEMEFRRMNKEIKLFCYCIMPDHLHILLSLTDDYCRGCSTNSPIGSLGERTLQERTLQNWVSAFKRYTTKTVKNLFYINRLWQKNFYDHIVRKEESLIKIAEYIINNPVRKDITPRWEKYPYSRVVDPLPL